MNIKDLHEKLNEWLTGKGYAPLSPEEYLEQIATMEVKGEITNNAGEIARARRERIKEIARENTVE